MDHHSNGPIFPSFLVSRKRPWSPDLGNNTPTLEPTPTGLDRLPKESSHRNITGKRPRISTPTDDLFHALEPGNPTFRGNCRTLADLPPQILQHIFTFIGPIALGRLICVNGLFRSLLDPACALPQRPVSGQPGRLALRTQNSIWSASRKAFFPGFLRPMENMTEMEMWRLIRGSSCQFCGKKATEPVSFSTSDLWQAGPGLDNVRPIWPFRTRLCGRCLEPRLIKVRVARSSHSEQYLISSRNPN